MILHITICLFNYRKMFFVNLHWSTNGKNRVDMFGSFSCETTLCWPHLVLMKVIFCSKKLVECKFLFICRWIGLWIKSYLTFFAYRLIYSMIIVRKYFFSTLNLHESLQLIYNSSNSLKSMFNNSQLLCNTFKQNNKRISLFVVGTFVLTMPNWFLLGKPARHFLFDSSYAVMRTFSSLENI